MSTKRTSIRPAVSRDQLLLGAASQGRTTMTLGTDPAPYAAPIVEPAGAAIGKVALASAIGTAIEYFDFNLYAIATALVFNKIFFPSFDPLIGTLAAFATFFIGFFARPLGRGVC